MFYTLYHVLSSLLLLHLYITSLSFFILFSTLYFFIFFFFFFNDTATTEIYTLSLHDALPISFEAILASVLDGLCGLHACLGDLQLFLREQRTVEGVHNVKDDFLVCAFKLMPGGVLHALRAIDRAPAPEGIKEIPGTAKACREV